MSDLYIGICSFVKNIRALMRDVRLTGETEPSRSAILTLLNAGAKPADGAGVNGWVSINQAP